MTNKELIEKLQQLDPDDEVRKGMCEDGINWYAVVKLGPVEDRSQEWHGTVIIPYAEI